MPTHINVLHKPIQKENEIMKIIFKIKISFPTHLQCKYCRIFLHQSLCDAVLFFIPVQRNTIKLLLSEMEKTMPHIASLLASLSPSYAWCWSTEELREHFFLPSGHWRSNLLAPFLKPHFLDAYLGTLLWWEFKSWFKTYQCNFVTNLPSSPLSKSIEQKWKTNCLRHISKIYVSKFKAFTTIVLDFFS